jgi:alpha-galactosidase
MRPAPLELSYFPPGAADARTGSHERKRSILMIRKRQRFFPVLGIVIGAVFFACGSAVALDNGLAKTPPMGWNSWNKFGCDVSEKLIKEMADALVSTGMKDAGYRYIVIDDCWQVKRDERGRIVADADRFPSGIKALADYIHSKGLKFGIYSDAGTGTCQGRPGSHGYEPIDARTYAEWGVDYLKYDWCNTDGLKQQEAYPAMRDALLKSGRKIVFSMCEWGSSQPWLWAKDVGNLWRTTGDIQDCWDCRRDWGGMGWLPILDLQAGLEKYAGPGHWNDPDMLEVGNGGMTFTEYKSHFSLWCLLASPLMAGNDLRTMSPEIRDILTNREVISLNQDKLGIQGSRIRDDGDQEVWAKRLKDGSRAVVLFNRDAKTAGIKVNWQELGLTGGKTAKVRDLWLHKDLGKFSDEFTAEVDPHGVVVLKVKQ